MFKQFLSWLCITTLVLFILFQLSIDHDIRAENRVVVKQLNDFNWLKNSNYLPSFIQPEVDTALYLPSNINRTKERDFIACFVLSTPKNVNQRNAIRQTWGSVIKPIFIVARSDNNTMRLLIDEAMLFNDIIVENFVDSYVNLTIKTAFAMKHFLRHFKDSTYFFKIDDDVFLNVENLFKMIDDDKNVPKDAIIGRRVTDLKPHREKESKLYIPRWLFEDDFFPTYHDGPAYLIPGKLIENIFGTSMKVPFFTIEDAFFLGEVAGKMLNITLLDNKHFRTFRMPYVSPCLYRHYITVHNTSPSDTIDVWKSLAANYSCSLSEKIFAYFIYKKDMIS